MAALNLIYKPKMLIGLAGVAGAGKSTVAKMLCKEYGFIEISFAEPIKRMIDQLLGYKSKHWDDRAWKEACNPRFGRSPRQLMQSLGTEWGRNIVHPDIWIDSARLAINGTLGWQHKKFVISDVRFDNEAAWIRANGGVLWRIYSSSDGPIPDAVHPSEAQEINWQKDDWEIINRQGIDDLHSLVSFAVAQSEQPGNNPL